jgi:hypothetical protein
MLAGIVKRLAHQSKPDGDQSANPAPLSASLREASGNSVRRWSRRGFYAALSPFFQETDNVRPGLRQNRAVY